MLGGWGGSVLRCFMAPGVGFAHAVDESIDLEDLISYTKVLIGICHPLVQYSK